MLSLLVISSLMISPINAQKFGKRGGVASNDSTYNGQGEVTNGTYSINGDTGAAKLGPIISSGPIETVSTITASNISGVNTGDQTSVSGNAGTATKLQTARAINGVPFDGTGPITINATDSVARLAAANNLSDVVNSTTARTNLNAAARGTNSDITSLTGLTTPLSVAQGGTGANSASAARTSLAAAASGANTDITSITGSAASLTTARTLSLTGDVTGSTTFNGTANAATAATLSTVNTNVGTFGSGTAIPIVTVDGKGRVTAVSTASVITGGTVSDVSVTSANGVSGTVATSTTTPAITLSLGAITPTSVAVSNTVTGTSSAPTLSVTPTWNTTGTPSAILANVTNTASNVSSRLIDLQVGSTSQFSVSNMGAVTSTGGIVLKPSNSSGISLSFFNNELQLGSALPLSWSSGTPSSVSTDLSLFRDAANILAQRNGVAAQTYRLYNTFTDTNNFERLNTGWIGNTATIWTSAAGTGTLRSLLFNGNDIQIQTGGVNRWIFNGAGHLLTLLDNTYDIGSNESNRARDLFLGRNFVAGGTISGSNLSGTNTGDQTITLTGDVTGSGTGSFATTLPTVNSNVGSFGSTTTVPIITVNGKGLITAASTATLGSAAVKNTGTSGNVVALLDATNTWSAVNNFTGNINSDYQLRINNNGTGANTQALLTLTTGTPNSYIFHKLHDNAGSPYYHLASGPAVNTGYFDFDSHVFRNKGGITKATWSANGNFTMAGVATFDGADAEERRVVVKGGKLSVNSFNGVSASATEAMDWPVPPFSIRAFGDFTSQTMAMFGLANDPEYVVDESIWNIKLYQTANSLTSSGVTGLSLIGPGQLILGSGSTPRVRFTSGGDVLIGTSSRSIASLGTATFFGSEVMSRGSNAGYFWEDRSGSVTATSNWGGWYQSSGVTFLYNGGANVASINMSSGAYAALSDARKKDRFVDSDLGLESVKLVTPTFYNLKNTDPVGAPRKLGFRAQDIEAAGIDAAVVRINTTDALGIDNEWLGLDPMPLIAVLWKATRDLSTKVDALEERIARLEALMTP